MIMILAIISHTQHYKDKNGTIVGWGATVRELDQSFRQGYSCGTPP